MNRAADAVMRFTDDLAGIRPSGAQTWTASYMNPSTGAFVFRGGDLGEAAGWPEPLNIAENEIRIYLGGRKMKDTLLAQSSLGDTLVDGAPEWVSTVRDRAQGVTQGSEARDTGAWGGSISFNHHHDWYTARDPSVLGTQQKDLYSVAVHEILHILGMGASDSWRNLVNSQGQFTGQASLRASSPSNPELFLDDPWAHWKAGTLSKTAGMQSEALMTPYLPAGQRLRPTDLDWAALEDIGWDPAAIGDVNRDGLFDTTDIQLLVVADSYRKGVGYGWSQGDMNGDGQFNSTDIQLMVMAGTYRQGSISSVQTIPEPSGLGLLSVAAALASLRRKARS
jgi:hypothetical protein